MTVVFETPPGNVPGDLVARFTLDREPTSVSVRYFPVDSNGDPLPGSWDVVYGETDSSNENGEFSDKFLDSERSGNLWTIRPPGNGIWPCRFRVVVDEVPATGSATWDLIYSFDLTTISSGAFSSGVNVIGGLSWYLKGSPSTGWTTAKINGSGIRQTVGSAGQAWSTGALAGHMVWFPLTQVPNFNPAAPFCLFAQLACSATIGTANMIGALSCADSASAFSSGERASECWFGPNMDSGAVGEASGNGAASTISESSPIGGQTYNTNWSVQGGGALFGVVWVSPRTSIGLSLNTTSFPADWQTAIGRQHDTLITRSVAMTNPGLAWRIRDQVVLTGTTYDLKKIAVYQPRPA